MAPSQRCLVALLHLRDAEKRPYCASQVQGTGTDQAQAQVQIRTNPDEKISAPTQLEIPMKQTPVLVHVWWVLILIRMAPVLGWEIAPRLQGPIGIP